MKKKENYPSFSSPKDAVSRSITHVAASVLVNLSSSSDDRDSDLDTDSDSNSEGDNGVSSNKNKFEEPKAVLPVAQLPLPSSPPPPSPKDSRRALALVPRPEDASLSVGDNNCRQFWKAGEFEGFDRGVWDSSSGGMDHVRVHPKFLHSNATSHKWALGAFAELLDNSLDEVCNGATYVSIDMIPSMKDGSKMILIEDDGGGMDPDRMRQCMSLGYSAKSKIANTIGQYGNGFKTSTMRLGADVIVFSRCRGKDGKRPTQSIGLLSYTFLRSTGKEDIVVPMLDYEWDEQEWEKMTRFSAADWNRNVETITDWSPFSSETDLLLQFSSMSDHGTRIIIYNLWEEDEGQLELDFEADPHDIQLRGVNRDEKNIQMAKQYPNSWHFLTYKHSLRSYASILYLRLPPSFQIILRGKAVQHHNIVNDLMLCKEITYRPQFRADVAPRDLNMTAEVTVGFVKDAKHHIDVQGFNVYHKNRLIKPFWRIWNPAGVDGRGVIGVLEANFIEPAHDKQGFERTVTLARLETRLIAMQRTYWTNNCHFVGYKPRGGRKNRESADSLKRESERFVGSVDCGSGNGDMRRTESEQDVMSKRQSLGALTLPSLERIDACGSEDASPESGSRSVDRLRQKNLLQRLQKRGGEVKATVMHILECEKCDSLKKQVEETEQRIEELTKERESLVDVFADERERRNMEEEQLRKRVKNASNTVQELLNKVKLLEMKKASNCKA